MKELKGIDRINFMYNQGVRYGTIGYYRYFEEAWEAFSTFKPYSDLNIGEGEDEKIFKVGYLKGKKFVIKLQLAQKEAQSVVNEILGRISPNENENVTHYTEMKSWNEDNLNVTEEEKAELKSRGGTYTVL